MLKENLNVEELTIERCNKETDELIKQESPSFLEDSLEYLKRNRNQYIFLEADWFDKMNIDGLSIELDDVFGNFEAMFGLKLQKKYRGEIEMYLERTLQGEKRYELLFNGDDGLWDVNISINDLPLYNEGMSLIGAIEIICGFLFEMIEEIKEGK